MEQWLTLNAQYMRFVNIAAGRLGCKGLTASPTSSSSFSIRPGNHKRLAGFENRPAKPRLRIRAIRPFPR